LSLHDILTCVGFSESTFWRVLKLCCETGNIISPTCSLRGRSHVLHCDNVLYLTRFICHHPGWFLDELLELLDTNCFISVHCTTIHCELERIGVSLIFNISILAAPLANGHHLSISTAFPFPSANTVALRDFSSFKGLFEEPLE
ncbi:hypothetical protein BDR03DRAFT_858671, partial [Suillus americanus]